ncbi:glycosyltransferase family 4 protein [Gallibacterium salpingitidis]|uniref:glycosyltransferase family 4 protein n=1 Tax=Gallibacterium salpingitidis TaxID=505341 RepID=UPI00266FB70E|nr:glycosyltransferase family 1 protein [Gallibacterium salpingitidis]WKT00464.1 glycosyltransferase family 4 protein [Gallibacterium salpingitidis]
MKYIDITNYINTRAHTGIQRVVREFLFRIIRNKDDSYRIIYYNSDIKKFYLMSREEVYEFLQNIKYYKFSYNIDEFISLDDFKKGDIFFDIDGVWNNGLKRFFLYKKLKKNNVFICNFLYDFVPILMPKYSHIDTVRNFTMYIYSIYQFSDMVFFDSRSAEKDFYDIKEKIGNKRKISTRVIKLGGDLLLSSTDVKNKLFSTKYILFVGTLEPRKEQELVLDAFEVLYEKYADINLIFIGKKGWNNDKLIHRLENHILLNKRIFWLKDINDEQLSEFYRNAFLSIYLSKYEGFGLPILESLSYGNITITSNNSSMYEVGKNFADYIKFNSVNEIAELIDLYLSNPNLYSEKKKFIKKYFKPYSWDMTYDSILNIFNNIDKYKINNKKHQNKLQFVFISICMGKLSNTIKTLDTFVNFVKEYIIITSDNYINECKEIISENKIVVIDEKNILQDKYDYFIGADHQTKNWLLRSSLVNLDILDEQFIMLDDDNRPLKDIAIEHFIDDGKYNVYFYFDLLDWANYMTDYDFGQHYVKNVLDQDGYELLSYSSHKPQIIDKRIFREVVEKYLDIGLENPIDEWSIYFNYAISNYPKLFNKIKYDTLNWPGHPSNWQQKYFPSEYNFENYYENNFEGNLEEKIKNKKDIENLYINNIFIEKECHKFYKDMNMVYGVLSFKEFNSEVFLFNFPYFIVSNRGSWSKLILNYKTINCQTKDVKILYYIDNKKGAETQLPITEYYEDEIVEFGISSESLQVGIYNLFIHCAIDNKIDKYNKYLVKLIVV